MRGRRSLCNYDGASCTGGVEPRPYGISGRFYEVADSAFRFAGACCTILQSPSATAPFTQGSLTGAQFVGAVQTRGSSKIRALPLISRFRRQLSLPLCPFGTFPPDRGNRPRGKALDTAKPRRRVPPGGLFYFSAFSAASTKPWKRGWGRLGRLLNSGWNCAPTNHGCCGFSTISTSAPSGERPARRRPAC